ncbi:MAG: hypothetical protein K0S65_1796 [Labilithrix sp.]|nr:hypothetical protein [Labilithrix sp.]
MIPSDTAPEGASERVVVTTILLLSLVGCGEGRPPVESGSIVVSSLDGDAASARDDAPSEADEASPTGSCLPGDARECRRTYYDEHGQKHCPLSSQFCRSNGTWDECGVPPRPEDGFD